MYKASGSQNITGTKTPGANPNLWRERQLRDYRRANGLCYFCGDKYDPAHGEVCQKKSRAQVNALTINDLDQNITEDVLNQLAMEDVMSK
jgi:hypothetical protein